MSRLSPLELCALAEAQFYGAAFRALGVEVRRDEAMWWVEVPAPAFFNSAGTLVAGVSEAQVVRALAAIPGPGMVGLRDPFATLDLGPFGFARDQRETWMVRAPSPSPPAPPASPVDGFAVRRARTGQDVRIFERATFGHGGVADAYVEGALHPHEATLAEPDLHLLIGSVHGQVVATALAVVHPAVVGVQAVTTHPDWRRRGVASQMMTAVIAAAPDRPVALSSTPMAHRLYRRLGFVDAGRASDWERPAPIV